ncbi:PAAR domain-containing protein [Roseomonas sp. PWR1]|uniref:PAAR domain-containing protein n=1 Tax=Roseomonas nitratireducens TaxID=2820810 RepID=A0ABS4AM04_9PROT|nr:PAAR domain-containing protein [Neoroseomonas nitratireducens]MBP0462390.1 PAAR domain-containing protein [Neoroseomonas nitratireducens]
MPFPAARVLDMHVCPMFTGPVPHVGGPVLPPCCITVLINYFPAARQTDMCLCVGPPDTIMMGYPTVLVGKMPPAFLGSLTSHGGSIVMGSPNVIYGGAAGGGGGGGGGAQSAAAIAAAVNPPNSVINCGNIVDAVIDRLDGSNPNATAPAGQDGTFDEIAARHNTTMSWGHNLNDAYNLAQQGGDGTTLIVGITYPNNGGSHVVVMTNQGGTVSIVEGQNWGPGQGAGAITDPAVAQARYGPADVGIAIVPGNH